jgi:hypothetical protein
MLEKIQLVLVPNIEEVVSESWLETTSWFPSVFINAQLIPAG